MKFWRSLRVRLTVGFLLLSVSAVAIAAAATVLFVEQAILGTRDTALMEEATTLASLAGLPNDQLVAAVREMGSETDMGPGKFVSVMAADGVTLAASRRMPGSVTKRPPRTFTTAEVATTGEDDAMFRVAWAPTRTGGVVVVGVHASREVRRVQRARWVVSLLAGTLLAVLGAGTWAVTGRATQELERLTAEVATLEAGSLERRLSARRTDEVDRLVGVLNRVFERLERSVAQLRRFTADAAHELRTPLAALRTRLEVALCREGTTVPRDVVVDALEQTERLGRLAEDLLMLARVEGGAVSSLAMETRVDLTALVEEVATALAPVAEEQARPFGWQAAPALWVRGSAPLLKRVVVNLVDNAFRHTPATAGVTLTARREGQLAVIEVRDEGPGIDPAVLPHVFERFRHGAGGGSGLGLALVREIVESHRGTVSLETLGGGGTRARVSLTLMDVPGDAGPA